MTFADVFPMLTDEQVDEYQKTATKAECRELAGYLAVQQVINPRPAKHIVSTSLFWKNTREDEPEIVITTRAKLLQRDKKELMRFDPWEHYMAPLLRGAYVLAKQRPDIVMRVYLAADLEFLVPDLLLAGCEIYLMQTSSLAHNPGALWRYLAFEEKEKWVTVVDADRAPHMLQDIERTEGTAKVGLGWWRVPVWGELNRYGKMNYRPFLGCQLGACTWLPMNLLMQAMIWHSKRGSMPHTATPPGCAAAEIAGHDWPNYGYDEWFLSAAVYPRAAMDGILTFVPSDAKCRILALDVAYCLQMNQQSEMAYFGSNGTGCCGSAGTSNKAPGLVRPREDSTVVLRNRSGKKTAPALFEFTKVLRTKGGVKAALAATEHIDTIWWVDVADDLVPGPTGAELFLDQRFAQCDLGVTGWQFVVVTAEIAKWAKRQGCAGPKWGAGAALRVPKLDAPLTLWRSAFSSKVSEALKIVNNSDITGEVLLSAWAATGKASILEASIKSQGWTLKSTQNS